jgi:hypothetical protein
VGMGGAAQEAVAAEAVEFGVGHISHSGPLGCRGQNPGLSPAG